MITAKQVAAARALLGLSQENLARLAGLSRATLSGVENDYDSRVSSLREIERALTAQGIVFTKTGVAQKMQWGENPPPPEIRKRVLSGLNDARRARGNPPLIDSED